MTPRVRRLIVLPVLVLCATFVPASFGQGRRPLTAKQRQNFAREQRELQKAIDRLPDSQRADASIFAKGLEWALRYDRTFSPKEVALLKRAVQRGRERVTALAAGKTPWKTRKGRIALGYVSRVDGSVQPYGMVVPKGHDPTRPIRLDVVLHGSTRPVGLSELRFISRFDEGDSPAKSISDKPYIELHPLGRVENCYRWAGETDVFEAIEDVCRRYNIDRRRIVLRGMSMGASGTWHLGLKHPDRFVALGPYCGYVDTHHFSETPLKNFVKVGRLPPHQELGLHMLDSVDYAANAGVVPSVACMGEKDVFFQAHVLMAKAMKREGLTMVNLISPGTGHVIDPVTHAEQMRRIAVHAKPGLNRAPSKIRFVTWTLKYSRCHWLQVLGLRQHYARAEISAERKGNVITVAEPKNITRFAILTAYLPVRPTKIRVGNVELTVPKATAARSRGFVVVRRGNTWAIAGDYRDVSLTGKRPTLQGPIDDAFTSPFLCVRGTGKPWNAAVHAYSNAALDRFIAEWRHYFRGECPVKNDVDVTAEDVRTKNLILFGDPGSNRYIAKVLPKLPLTWTKKNLRMVGRDYDATTHLPAMIAPSPLPGGENRYVVLNSGHTFREKELASLNYLLFPRWGDWAVLKLDPHRPVSKPLHVTVVRAGYFNEQWRFPE